MGLKFEKIFKYKIKLKNSQIKRGLLESFTM